MDVCNKIHSCFWEYWLHGHRIIDGISISNGVSARSKAWVAPSSGSLKINVDGAFDKDLCAGGLASL